MVATAATAGNAAVDSTEPTFKYQRLGGSVSKILAADAASCLAAHVKFLALGTEGGAVHVLDLGGNEIRRFSPHSAAVTDICLDATGEFVGSCSNDGTVVVSSLFGGEASTHWYHRPVRAIALDPEYAARRNFATGGLAEQLVINSRGWFGSKDNVVHAGEGPVQAIAMAGPMLAWANDLGVKVYDAQHAKRVSYIERTPGAPPPQLFKCHMRWESRSELLIGWADTIKIGRVREREAPLGGSCAAAAGGAPMGGVGAGGGGGLYMEVVTLIQTDFYIAGLGGVAMRTARGATQSDLLVLAYMCEPADEDKHGPGGAAPGGAQRPELRLLSRHNDEFFADALSIEGFEDLRCGSYSFALPPRAALPPSLVLVDDDAAGARLHSRSGEAAGAMSALRHEVAGGGGGGGGGGGASSAGGGAPTTPFGLDADGRLLPETTAYIVSPRDIVVARSRNWDDRVGWLLARGKVEAALGMATAHAAELKAHRVMDIAEVHIGSLLRAGEHTQAAQTCVVHLGRNPELWSRWLRAFATVGALTHIAPHVPVSNPQLPPEAYEHALASAITPSASSAEGPGAQLLALLRQWPATVYRPAVAQRSVLEAARRLPGGLLAQPRLMEAMALLHCHAKQHEAALRLLLQLPPHEVDVFAFIELHSVHGYCRDKVEALAAHSWEKCLALLLRYTEAIPPEAAVAQLDNGEGGEARLFEYLHALFLQDVHMGAAFHGRQLGLYARHDPAALLPFLKVRLASSSRTSAIDPRWPSSPASRRVPLDCHRWPLVTPDDVCWRLTTLR